MKIFIDRKKFKVKPNEKEAKSVNFRLGDYIKKIETKEYAAYNCSLNYLAKKIKEGHSFNMALEKNDIELLIFDVDEGYTSFDELFKDLLKYNLRPNIMYPSFSYKKGVNIKMRCIFKMDKGYTSTQLKEIYKMIKEFLPRLDGCMSNWRQPIYGTCNEVWYRGEDVSFNPKTFAIENKWKPKKIKKESMDHNEVKEIPKGKKTISTLEFIAKKHILENGKVVGFGLENIEMDYLRGLAVFKILEEFGIEDKIKLKLTSKGVDSTERYIKKYKETGVGAKRTDSSLYQYLFNARQQNLL